MRRLLFLCSVALFLVACGGASNSNKQISEGAVQADVTEVLYFHGKKRCITCNAIERLTKEVIDSLADEKVVMKIVDISEPEGETIADKYEVTWSSLILDRGGKVENLTDMGFGYAKNQPEAFKAKLVEAIANITK